MAKRKAVKKAAAKKRVNSRAKGARGELECAAMFKEMGYEARRGQQFSGGGDSPDVVHSIPGVHAEVKRVEAGNLYNWLAQAKRDAKKGNTPIVFHKRSHKDWVAIMSAQDFFKLLMLTPIAPAEPAVEEW